MILLAIIGGILAVKLLSGMQQTVSNTTSPVPTVVPGGVPAQINPVNATAISDAPANLAAAYSLYSQIIKRGIIAESPATPYSINYDAGKTGTGGGGAGGGASGGAGGGRPVV